MGFIILTVKKITRNISGVPRNFCLFISFPPLALFSFCWEVGGGGIRSLHRSPEVRLCHVRTEFQFRNTFRLQWFFFTHEFSLKKKILIPVEVFP